MANAFEAVNGARAIDRSGIGAFSNLVPTFLTNVPKRAVLPRALEFNRKSPPLVDSAESLHLSRGGRGRLFSRFRWRTRLSIHNPAPGIWDGFVILTKD